MIQHPHTNTRPTPAPPVACDDVERWSCCRPLDQISCIYDFILCGSGPGAAAWLRSTLRHAPTARILLLERGPYCTADVLTEWNPLRLLRDTDRVVASYSHSVMQGRTFGGGTAVNNYAWVTPSYSDLKNALDVKADEHSKVAVESYQEMCEDLLGELYLLLTASRKEDVGLINNNYITVELTNRNHVILGRPTLTSTGVRRSAFTSVTEPLARKHLRNLDIIPDMEVL